MNIKKIRTRPEILTEILKIAIPISIGATVGTVMTLIDSVLVPQKLLEAGIGQREATILYAQLTGKASVITNIPLTISVAIGASLIPIIAECYALKRGKELSSKINMAFKLSMVIALPCAIGIFILSNPIMNMIFPGKAEGAEILKYMAITVPFIVITQTTTSILQGIDNYIYPVINLFVGCIVKVILTMWLVPIFKFNIYGAVIASIGAYMVSAILNMIVLKIKIQGKMSIREWFFKPIIASALMGTVVALVYKYASLSFNNIKSCLLSIIMGIIVYIVSVMIFRIFSVDEIRNRLTKN